MLAKWDLETWEDSAVDASRIGVFLASAFDLAATQETVAAGTRPQPEFVALHEKQGFDLVGLPRSLPRGGSIHWRLAANLLKPKSMIGLHRLLASYDALVLMGEDVGVPLALSLPALTSRTKIFVVCHGTFFNSGAFRNAMKLLRLSDKVHMMALSEAIRLQLVRDFGFAPSHVHTIGQAVDTNFYSPGIGSDRGLIVSAGAVNRDYPTLFAAVEPLDVRVKIAVNSAWTASANVSASPPSNVILCEPPLGHGLRDLYRKARVVVVPLHPVRYACGYSTIFEAMAVGKPVITTRMQGQSDIVVDGETGFLVDPGNVSQLRDRIDLLTRQPELAQRMGEAARRKVMEVASLPNYTRNFAALVRSKLSLVSAV